MGSAHWAFYYTTVYKNSKNLKNGHFLQSRIKIVLIEIKFAKFWYIGGWCAPVCLIDTLKNLVFYSKVTIKAHWTYLLQILSKLCFQRVAFSGNYEIVAISTDKTTIFNDLDYKADIGQHFHKSEKSARWRHRHKIIKTNLKTLVSPLLMCPQGIQRVSKDVPGSTKHASWGLVCPNIEENLKKSKKTKFFLTFFLQFWWVFWVCVFWGQS